MAVGEVQIQTLQPGQALCVQPLNVAQSFRAIPINNASGLLTASFTANSITPDIKRAEATPSAVASDSLLSPLPSPEEAAAPSAKAIEMASSAHREMRRLLASPERQNALVPLGQSKFGSAVPTVDQILSIQVTPGCTGSADIRAARVEAVSPEAAGRPRLYVLQEVVDDGLGGWMPAVTSGLTRAHFENVYRAYEEAFDPLASGLEFGSPTVTITRVGARDLLETNFGAVQDVDGNGGVFVFFTRRLNEASPPASSTLIASRFDARDLLASAACPLSNEGEIVYMALPDPTGSINSNVRTVSFVAGQLMQQLSHQMTRLTNAGRRLYVQNAALEEPWLDETLAWASSELLFFASSVGLAPRTNIVLSTLTTGPNASRRVAAFNSYQNRIFASYRQSFLIATGATPAGRYSLLTDSPPSAAVFETENERISYFYGAAAAFLRYALDRRNGGDAATLRSLVDSDLTGIANLEAAFGAEMRAWLHDFGVAAVADDLGLALAPEYRTPSWDYRSLFTALNGSYPVVPLDLASGGAAQTFILGAGGGQRWLSFGLPAGTNGVSPAATVQYTVDADAPMSPLKIAVVRTQ
jgi:hypothetical protein